MFSIVPKTPIQVVNCSSRILLIDWMTMRLVVERWVTCNAIVNNKYLLERQYSPFRPPPSHSFLSCWLASTCRVVWLLVSSDATFLFQAPGSIWRPLNGVEREIEHNLVIRLGQRRGDFWHWCRLRVIDVLTSLWGGQSDIVRVEEGIPLTRSQEFQKNFRFVGEGKNKQLSWKSATQQGDATSIDGRSFWVPRRVCCLFFGR